MPILAGDTWDSNVILEAAKGTDLSICVTTFYQEGAAAEFDSGIKAWINSDSTALANNGGNDELAAVTAMGYDAYYVALEALKQAGSTDPSAVLKVLPSLTYTGVTGNIASYAELYFTDVRWPDFTREELIKALKDFAGRERRFGGLKTNGAK